MRVFLEPRWMCGFSDRRWREVIFLEIVVYCTSLAMNFFGLGKISKWPSLSYTSA